MLFYVTLYKAEALVTLHYTSNIAISISNGASSYSFSLSAITCFAFCFRQ